MAERDTFDRIGLIVVEDEALIRNELVEAFSYYGFYVLGAEDAAEALKVLQEKGPHIQVVFTDVHLPGATNGVVLGQHIRKTWPWISLLVTSGYGTPDPSQMPDGSRFVLKPYKISRIAEQIREMVRGAHRGND